MSTINYKTLLEHLMMIKESLHPELQDVIQTQVPRGKRKQTILANKIKDLHARGEKTGIEGNMPKGSSRAYLKHETPEKIMVDGKQHDLHVGTKAVIRAHLDPHHNHEHFGGSLGQLQNEAENGDGFVNDNYRVLTHSHDDEKGNKHYKYNEDGIFPPLVDHDYDDHHWSTVGHSKDITKKQFKELTKTESHPEGIRHQDFVDALVRQHNRHHGKHWGHSESREKELDHIDTHPLLEKFHNFHDNYGAPPHDYQQLKNLGVFEHDGKKHIVARDHGYSSTVMDAYQKAQRKKYKRAW